MKIINILKNSNKGLEVHVDDRGIIADVFYNANIHHVAIVRSVAWALRGNHYHAKSTQHMLMTKGIMQYWYKDLNFDGPAKCITAYEGDLITTPPYEIHALRYLDSPAEFVVFTEGPRGGKDYEADTFRVANIAFYQ